MDILINIAKKIARPLLRRFRDWLAVEVRMHILAAVSDNNQEIRKAIHSVVQNYSGGKQYRPALPVLWDINTPFMAFSTCSAQDFMHPRFSEICAMIRQPPVFHRKVWEWVFVIHHLLEAGAVGEGRRGLVFGVGQEKLPALFASLGAEILATDAPDEIGKEGGWKETGQFTSGLSPLRSRDIVSDEVFDAKVSYRPCDMTDIESDLKDFDFNWSSCCFEHLGSLDAGIEFVIKSVEKTLKKGGVAVHTTEFNMSSNDRTLETGATVIYRKKDIERLIARLQERGHLVQPFLIAPNSHMLDFYYDVPPYTHDPHIRLLIEDFVCTSVGLVIRRGP